MRGRVWKCCKMAGNIARCLLMFQSGFKPVKLSNLSNLSSLSIYPPLPASPPEATLGRWKLSNLSNLSKMSGSPAHPFRLTPSQIQTFESFPNLS